MNIDALSVENLRRRGGEKWSHYDADILPAWVADMDFEIAEPIVAAIAKRLTNSDCGYPRAAAESGLPEIFCERVAERFDWHVSPDQVDLFNDVVQAIYFGLLGLSAAGDGVVIQTPIYPPFLGSTREVDRRLALSPLIFGAAGFEIDFDHLEAQIDARTRILLLCNPHNPSGRCFTRGELEQLGELVLRHGLYVISDEIHADLVFQQHRHIPIASLSPELARRTVTLMSASKAFNIAGVCMAFAVFGDPRVRRLYESLPRHLRGGLSALSIAGVGAALSEGQPWLDKVLAYLQTNRDFLSAHANTHWSAARHAAPQATYLSWFDFGAYDLKPNPYAFFLQEAKVALSDGARFGEPGRGCVRVNFATSRAILEQVVARMDAALPSPATGP